MAKQKGNPMVGTIRGVSYYHDKVHGYLVRMAGGPTKQQIKRKKSFALVRKNNTVFGEASSFNSELRNAFHPLLLLVKDYHTSRRLQSLLRHIINLIRTGNAQPGDVLAKEFKTFELLKDSCFTNLFTNMTECVVNEDTVELKGRLSVHSNKFGEATHVQFTTCVVIISNNWKKGRIAVQQTPVLQLKKVLHMDLKHDLDTRKKKGYLFYGVVVQLFREDEGDIRLIKDGPHCGFLSYQSVLG